MQRAPVGQMEVARSDLDPPTDPQRTLEYDAFLVETVPMRRKFGARGQTQQIRENTLTFVQHFDLHAVAKSLPDAVSCPDGHVSRVGIGDPLE